MSKQAHVFLIGSVAYFEFLASRAELEVISEICLEVHVILTS